MIHGIANFAQIMRWNRSRHADRNSAGAIDQQIGKLARQHRRLHPPLIVGRRKIDRIELQILQHQRGDRRHAGLGISHRGRRQSGDRTKVSLLVDQHMTHVPFLRHPHQRRIDDTLTVRVIITAGIAGNFRTFDSRCDPESGSSHSWRRGCVAEMVSVRPAHLAAPAKQSRSSRKSDNCFSAHPRSAFRGIARQK